MKYGTSKNGVEVIRDSYGVQFSSHVKTRYSIELYSMTIVQDEDTREISKELEILANELLKWSRHFSKFKKNKQK